MALADTSTFRCFLYNSDESFLELLLTLQRLPSCIRVRVEEHSNNQVFARILRDPDWCTPASSSAASCLLPILFHSSPYFLPKFPSLQTSMPLWLCIFSCSSAEDHFDVYFTATAKRRRVISHTPRWQSEERACRCACVSSFALLLFHWSLRELSGVYANEAAFKHMPQTINLK